VLSTSTVSPPCCTRRTSPTERGRSAQIPGGPVGDPRAQ
jgi:hypothetical protein